MLVHRKKKLLPPPPPVPPVPPLVPPLDYRDARAANQLYLARLRQVEFEVKIGNLVSRKSVQEAAYNKARVLRDALLGLPARLSAQLAAESDSHKVHEILQAELRMALQTLSADAGPIAGTSPTGEAMGRTA